MGATRQPADLLVQGLEALGISLDESRQAALLAYTSLLVKWNRVYNLTAVREPGAIMIKHILDSLAVIPHLHGDRIIDVGTGGGLPGIPLAIALPQRRFTLLDSVAKKTRFLTQARMELNLGNVEVVTSRVEDHHPQTPYDTVISRAFASLHDMLRSCAHLCSSQGEFLSLKGSYPQEELDHLPAGFRITEVIPLDVPFLGAARHLVRIAAPEG